MSDSALTWNQLLKEWRAVEADFTSHYGMVLIDNLHRSSRWLRTHLIGLLSEDTRISRLLAREAKK